MYFFLLSVWSTLFWSAFSLLSPEGCGPSICYSGCSHEKDPVEFVLLVDSSRSMLNKLTTLYETMDYFAQVLESRNIEARYSIVQFGRQNMRDPTLVLNSAEFSSLIFSMNKARREMNGMWEPGLETIRCSLGRSKSHQLQLSARDKSSRQKVMLLFTAEDSDPAMHQPNRYQRAATRAKCLGNVTRPFQARDPENYFREIEDTAAMLVDESWNTYFFVPSNDQQLDTCNTFFQYGNPTLQVHDATTFNHFRADETLRRLEEEDDHKASNSLQARLLRAGLVSRVFPIEHVDESSTLRRILSAVAEDLSSCDTTCFNYSCSNGTCVPPTNVCDCKGKRYGTATVDCFGVCGGNATVDCFGVCGGKGDLDECNLCTPMGFRSPLCQQGCDGTFQRVDLESPTSCDDACPDPEALDPCGQPLCEHKPCYYECDHVHRTSITMRVDECGECVPFSSTHSTKDPCGRCTNMPTYDATKCQQDCLGNFYWEGEEHARLDFCSVCVPPGGIMNTLLGICGNCLASYEEVQQDTHHRVVDDQGWECECDQQPSPCYDGESIYSYTCRKTCSLINDQECIPVCPPPPKSCPDGAPQDDCGHCPGELMYGKKDDCGLCCSGEEDCNRFKDSCGECFGLNRLTRTNECGFCNATDCWFDCKGTVQGESTLDCEGVCDGDNTLCFTCGNGVIDAFEECDEGEDNGKDGSQCTEFCQVKKSPPGTSLAITGTVIGSAAGLGIVLSSAWIMGRYLKKRGITASVWTKLQFPEGQKNPLYEDPEHVFVNPLYDSNDTQNEKV